MGIEWTRYIYQIHLLPVPTILSNVLNLLHCFHLEAHRNTPGIFVAFTFDLKTEIEHASIEHDFQMRRRKLSRVSVEVER